MNTPATIPTYMRELSQWVCWKLTPADPKPRKLPINPRDGKVASSTDSATWTTYDQALFAAKRWGATGLGFVFASDDGLVVIDLDGCRDRDTGALQPWASELIGQLDSYTEISPSGTGVHIIVQGLIADGRGRKSRAGSTEAIEVYDRARFFCMTGNHLADTPDEALPRQDNIDELVDRIDSERRPKAAAPVLMTASSQADVVERARRYVAKMDAAVSGQRGHDQAFEVACRLVEGFALTIDQARPILAEYSTRCSPPWSERELEHKLDSAIKRIDPARHGHLLNGNGRTHAPTSAPVATVESGNVADDIRAELWRIVMQSKLTATEKNRAIADAVVFWLHGHGQFYFDAERRNFASVLYFSSTDKTLLPVQSDAFQASLSDALAMNRSERMFRFVQSAVETEGLSSRSTAILPAAYWARTPDAIYISNGPGHMVRVRADLVELVDNGTDGVLFPYGSTLEPWVLTDPIDPFEACALFRDLSATASHGRDLFRLFGASLPTDQPNKPPLVVSGPVGSGKTAVTRGLFELYGLPARIMAVLKGGESDFWAALDAGGLVTFDNADTSIDWLPDALAGAATGGSQVKRRLYTDADQVVLRARSWIIITSASPTFASDAGLADRLLVVRQDRRRGETAESALFDEIRRHRHAGLSWIAQTLSQALADASPVPKNLNARHPDFATMAVRIGRAIGREQETITALRAAEADKHLFNLENDAIGIAVLDLVRSESFDGTAADLLDALKTADASTFDKMTTKRLAKRLGKLWPHLESALKAYREVGHGGAVRYSFETPNGDIGDNERPFSGKPLTSENNRTLYENTPSNSPKSPTDVESNL